MSHVYWLAHHRIHRGNIDYVLQVPKVETPDHDNDLIMTPVISPQSGWQ
jgi:hypothetical protein